MDELTIFVDELKQNNVKFGPICLQETWLADDKNYSVFNLPGYTGNFQGKRCSERGGLVFYLNNIYNYTDYLFQIVLKNGRLNSWKYQVFSAHKKFIIGKVCRLHGGKIMTMLFLVKNTSGPSDQLTF